MHEVEPFGRPSFTTSGALCRRAARAEPPWPPHPSRPFPRPASRARRPARVVAAHQPRSWRRLRADRANARASLLHGCGAALPGRRFVRAAPRSTVMRRASRRTTPGLPGSPVWERTGSVVSVGPSRASAGVHYGSRLRRATPAASARAVPAASTRRPPGGPNGLVQFPPCTAPAWPRLGDAPGILRPRVVTSRQRWRRARAVGESGRHWQNKRGTERETESPSRLELPRAVADWPACWAYLDPTEDAPASSLPSSVARAEPPPNPADRGTGLVAPRRTESESLAGAAVPTPRRPRPRAPRQPTTEGA